MINFLVIVDNKMGMANDQGIPWQPLDQDYFREKTTGTLMVMGYATYQEFAKPLPNRRNLVVVRPGTPLKPGFEPIEDVAAWQNQHANDNVWNIGGAKLFAKTLNQADRIYITRIDHDFNCTKFFPEFENDFTLTSKSPNQQKNGFTFRFEVWQRNGQ